MTATDFVRIRGLKSSPEECFQGFGDYQVAAETLSPLEKPGVPTIPPGAQVQDQSVIGKILDEVVNFVRTYTVDLQQLQQATAMATNAEIKAYNMAHSEDAPLPTLPAIPDRAGPIVKFVQGWILRLSSLPVAVVVENIDKIHYAIATVKDVMAICGKAKDFVVGQPLENGLLRYSPFDPLRILPKSLLKEGLLDEATGKAVLLQLLEAIESLDVENDFGVYRQTLRTKIYRE
jgi:hypothetical protein